MMQVQLFLVSQPAALRINITWWGEDLSAQVSINIDRKLLIITLYSSSGHSTPLLRSTTSFTSISPKPLQMWLVNRIYGRNNCIKNPFTEATGWMERAYKSERHKANIRELDEGVRFKGKCEGTERDGKRKENFWQADFYRGRNMSDIPLGVKLSCNSLFTSYSNTVMHTDNYNSTACMSAASIKSTSN